MTKDKTHEERRDHPRMIRQVHLRPLTVFGKNSIVEDISLGGLRIQSQKKYSLGKTLKIQMSLENREWAEANVRVVWINEKKQDAASKFDIGCEFINLPFDMQNELWVLLDKDSPSH